MAEDYTLTNPIDHTKIGSLPDEIRNVKALVVSGAARIFYQSAEPTTRYEGTTFTADDNGSIWVDSDDKKVYILTNYSGPTWTSIESVSIATLLAAARTFAEIITFSKSPVFTLGIVGNNSYLTGRNAANSANINMIKVGANDLPTLLDASEMASTAAPTEAEGIVNKKYVDDNEAATKYSVNPMTGDDDSDGTITFPNGMIQKWGKVSITGTEEKAVTFAVAFTAKCFQVIVCFGQTDANSSDRSLTAYTISKTGFTVRSQSGNNTICRWFAIGR